MPEAVAPETTRELSENQGFSFGQRTRLWFITWAGYLLIRLVGPTLRYRFSMEEGGPHQAVVPAVYSFWHRCVIPAAYHFRNRNIAVMTSRSFDGEYIARIIEKFGFQAVRGSSSRGAVSALLGMKRVLEESGVVAFTIDGPRGPKYVAKPGPVLLAQKSGLPMIAFYVALSHAWTLPSWDDFMIPQPFARAEVRISRMILVPGDASEADQQRYNAELQAALDRVRIYAEDHVGVRTPRS